MSAGRKSGGGATRLRAVVAVCLSFVCAAAVGAPASGATPPPKLASFPESVAAGAGANELRVPSGLAVNDMTGDVYVLDQDRIDEFTAWGEFVRAWGWGVVDGAPELQTCGPSTPEPAPDPGLCRAGLQGSGAGEFGVLAPAGIAVAPDGDVYVFERPDETLVGNARVQVFGPEGAFKFMFGGEVDQTSHGDLCTAASGDICGAGVPGSGNGQFQPGLLVPPGVLAIDGGGNIYVGDGDRIQVFSSAGSFERAFAAVEPPIGGVGVDSAGGRLYYDTFRPFERIPNPLVHAVDPAGGGQLGTIAVGDAATKLQLEGLAVDADGDLFVALNPICGDLTQCRSRVLEYGSDGEVEIGYADEFALPPISALGEQAGLPALATNEAEDLYVAESGADRSAISIYGPPPTRYGPPPQVPPAISDQLVVEVGETDATLLAKINPRFLADTSYYVEYGEAPCSTGGCVAQPPPPGTRLTTSVFNGPIATERMTLAGLQPATTYHYRFVAASSGGEERGLSGRSGDAAEGTFTTEGPPAAAPPCPGNQEFRGGPAAGLLDCRAYEMVSPVDKNGADVSVVDNSNGSPAGISQASESGEEITYSAYRAFGDAASSPYASQYLATRGPSGWTSTSISPPRGGPSFYSGGLGLDTPYKGFTDDLCSGWLLQDVDVPLAEGAVGGFPDVYRRGLCGGGYEAVAPARAPSGVTPAAFEPEVQGFSADGSKTIFTAKGKLTNNASAASQLYEAGGGQTRLVCVLPSKAALSTACSAGTGENSNNSRLASVSHVISADGQIVYWTSTEHGVGPLYVRVDHATTYAVSSEPAHFWDAAADGSKAIYSVGGELLEFDLADRVSTPIAAGFAGFVGASEDAKVVYFVSRMALAGSGHNDEGAAAVAGSPNLYRDDVGASPTFIATLAGQDLSEDFPSDTAGRPILHAARVSDDGSVLAFISAAPITRYDNADVATGAADSEVYVYGSGPGRVSCVSCLVTGARPSGRELQPSVHVAARLATAEMMLHPQRSLSRDGERLFFESFDPLSRQDRNGQLDVYEWEVEGATPGNCGPTAPGYDPKLDGCVDLISSGTSPQPSELVDSSADGRDVFFKTESSLAPQDPDLVDIYDAREGGGFPGPPPRPNPCAGEDCQPRQPGTSAAAPGSGLPGPGDPARKRPKPKPHKPRHHRHHHGKKKHGHRKHHPRKRAGR
jgi:DNA-binding beta-propeller fold protein YncE